MNKHFTIESLIYATLQENSIETMWKKQRKWCLLQGHKKLLLFGKKLQPVPESGLTFAQTSPGFYLSAVQKHCGKRKNCL